MSGKKPQSKCFVVTTKLSNSTTMVKFICYFEVAPFMEAKIEMATHSDTVGSWEVREACEKYAKKVGWEFLYSKEIEND